MPPVVVVDRPHHLAPALPASTGVVGRERVSDAVQLRESPGGEHEAHRMISRQSSQTANSSSSTNLTTWVGGRWRQHSQSSTTSVVFMPPSPHLAQASCGWSRTRHPPCRLLRGKGRGRSAGRYSPPHGAPARMREHRRRGGSQPTQGRHHASSNVQFMGLSGGIQALFFPILWTWCGLHSLQSLTLVLTMPVAERGRASSTPHRFRRAGWEGVARRATLPFASSKGELDECDGLLRPGHARHDRDPRRTSDGR